MPLGNLDDDQKKMVYESLLSKYEDVSNKADAGFQGEKELTKDAQMWNEIGRAAAKGGNAYAESVGGANFDTSGFDRIGNNLDKRLSLADKERKDAVNSYLNKVNMKKVDDQQKIEFDKLARLNDPMSMESRMSRDLAKKMGSPNISDQTTANELKDVLPYSEKIYSIDSKRREANSGNLKDQLQMQKYKLEIDEKLNEKDQKSKSLDTEYGRAISPKHADIIREANLTKKQFDRDIGELIALRKKYGAEMLNTDAVSRAQALSKDLLLSYKNLAKLGVLSKSDEDIVNAIIPSDPLQFNISSLWGQNPTLTVFTKFKEDLDKDFNDTLSTYIDGGAVKKSGGSNVEKPAAQSKPKTVIQNGFTYTLNEATGEYE